MAFARSLVTLIVAAAVVEGSQCCRVFCECNFSSSTWLDDDVVEWCKLKKIDGCIFGDGSESSKFTRRATCRLVSGRSPHYQSLLLETDPQKRCAAPQGVECPKARSTLFQEILETIEDAPKDGEASTASTWGSFGDFLKSRGYVRDNLLLLAQNAADGYSLLNAKHDLNQPINHHTSELADVIRLFGLTESVPRERLQSLMPSLFSELLIASGILVQYGSDPRSPVFSTVSLSNVEGGFFITDAEFMTDATIMHIGIDSMALASVSSIVGTGLRGTGKVYVLDLCTGSGVQGIIVAQKLREVQKFAAALFLVDINPRAGRFVQANMMLNKLESHAHFVHGDLYDALPQQSREFDIILANPPYWPVDNGVLYQSGGLDGERVTKRIISEGVGMLREKGRMALVTPIFNEDEFFDRFDAWFPKKDDATLNPNMLEPKHFDVMIIVSQSFSPEVMTSKYGENRADELRAAGIRSGAIHGLIFIKRCAASSSGCGRRIRKMQPLLWVAVSGCGQEKHDRLSCLEPKSAELRETILYEIQEFLEGPSPNLPDVEL